MDSLNVDVLGTSYTILYKKTTDDPKLEKCIAYCDPTLHKIVISISEDDVMNVGDIKTDNQRILRHELVHAFAFESGLAYESSWAMNEEMTDWIAFQFPKMVKCFEQIDAL